MSIVIYACDCGKEIPVDLGRSHKDQKDPNVYRIVCKSCGKINDVGIDDMSLREKTRAEIKANTPVTTFSWE
jgi:hypothetical protein